MSEPRAVTSEELKKQFLSEVYSITKHWAASVLVLAAQAVAA